MFPLGIKPIYLKKLLKLLAIHVKYSEKLKDAVEMLCFSIPSC